MDEPKDVLLRYLQGHRDAVLWKLEGLGEREVRWPVTPTGTNLLGLVKHLAWMELGYFGECFGRRWPDPPPWEADGVSEEDNTDLWATPEETRADVVGLYRRAWAHTAETVAARALTDTGRVPWWPPGRDEPTLHTLLVHVVAETARHAGHADIVREQLDGQAGLREGVSNLPEHDAAWWEAYVGRLRQAAEEAAARAR